MPPKKHIMAPIDRPLSRAYLREFSGWSTAYPPGLSDPTSLRIMENVDIGRDGSARVRPGLRYLSYASPRRGESMGTGLDRQMVGTHEAFYLSSGNKAYLFAVVEDDGTVGFRVLTFIGSGPSIRELDDPNVGFTIEAGLNFTAATTYVKYLQIDNKIFALSNAGEQMRIFHVGSTKSARAVGAITRPNWDVADKLTVIEPEASWITNGSPSGIRFNYAPNPSFETNRDYWVVQGYTSMARTAYGSAVAGGEVLSLTSTPQRTNLNPQPLHDLATTGLMSWASGINTPVVSVSGSYMRVAVAGGGLVGTAVGPEIDVEAGVDYKVAYDTVTGSHCDPVCYVKFYSSSGAKVGSTVTKAPSGSGRWSSSSFTAPSGAVTAKVFPGGSSTTGSSTTVDVKNLVFCEASESTAALDGDDGSDYYWTGTSGNSSSVYHPSQDLWLETSEISVSAGSELIASIHTRAVSTGRDCLVEALYFNGAGFVVGFNDGAVLADSSAGWTRPYADESSVSSGATGMKLVLKIADVPRNEEHLVDAAMVEKDTAVLGTYFDGDTTDTTTELNTWLFLTHSSVSVQQTFLADVLVPTEETHNADTLVSSDLADNTYQFGFFYTFNNEVGESAASQVTRRRAQRGWSSWVWELPDIDGSPSGTETEDPSLCCDQFVAYMPEAVFDAALAEGASSWSLYMFTWSDQDPVPTTAVKVGYRALDAASVYDTHGWLQVTPATTDVGNEVAVLPSAANIHNYSESSTGSQGLVAADRLIVVNDPVSPAVIRWTSNMQGEYTNFTAAKGGGYKTLTSGNLFVPACVKLWQNPQSVDTLTILCVGTDGYSTSYYMAPAQVAAQAEAVNLMGFEETTATPGTTSPYGVEVFNNALYHPLDDQLMKSTAMNYNISHKAQTDQIQNVWSQLIRKDQIVSSLHDGCLYYIVYNPDGEALEEGCNGNEVWVFDATAKTAVWSRWLVQAHSLRRVEQGGQLYMSVVKPDGIYYFDPLYGLDDVVDPSTQEVSSRAIPWRMETNTQGANRAHDANAHVQQANIVLGYFQGTMRYGIRAWDINGQAVEIAKLVTDENDPESLAFDLEDFLLIRRDLREWFFFAESIEDDDGNVVPSFGQLNLVQYRYTPSSVNTGYEYGSVETFEYGRAAAGVDTYTTNGTPVPMIDTRRP